MPRVVSLREKIALLFPPTYLPIPPTDWVPGYVPVQQIDPEGFKRALEAADEIIRLVSDDLLP